MVLGANVLNSDATLNWFFQISSLDFVPGSAAKLVIQLIDLQKDLRYVANSAATLTFTLNETDGSTVTKTGTILDSGDRSLWYVNLASSDTQNLLSGNFLFTLDVLGDGTDLISGQVVNGVRSLLQQC